MRFEQCRHIRCQHRDRIPGPDAAKAQRTGKPAAAVVELSVGETHIAMHNRELVRIHRGRARQERKRRQRREVGGVAPEMRGVVLPVQE